jgi:glycosidase
MMINKLKILVAILLLIVIQGRAQVTTEPEFPSADQSIRIIYDATLGTSALQGATKVYMHAGVILDSPTGTDWQNVVGNWGQDDGIGQMTKVSGQTDKWEITLTPRAYFSVDAGVDIYRIGVVFRNEDGSKEGKNDTNGDIFIDLSDGGFEMQLTSPTSFPVFVNQGNTLLIEASSSEQSNFTLNIGGIDVDVQNNTMTYSYLHTISESSGSVNVILTSDNGTETFVKDFSYVLRSATLIAARPSGIINGINYNTDPTKVTLSLLAPGKTSVYVIGDFNNWQVDPAYQMKLDGEHFWLGINGLTAGQEYIFQYLIDETIRVADPFTDKVSDPWDDKYIDAATYPGLIQYPTDHTNLRASVLQTAQQPYNWVNTSFTPPLKDNLVIYELLIRDFDQKHSYQGVIDRLDYLEDLGVNAIEFMPTNEFEGNLSWGYNPNFYFAPDKYYGPKNDFKALIDECHTRGIAVIIDLVLNHTKESSPMVRMYWNDAGNRPSPDNPWYNEYDNFENEDVRYWGADFNHESSYTKDFIDSVNTYWMNEYKIDGFRFDFTKGFSNVFKSNATDNWGSLYDASRIANLKRMADVIWGENPSAYVIFEHLSENSEEKELADYGIMLWGNMNHNYSEIAMGHPNGINLGWGYYQTRGWSGPNLVTYMESHDEERMMYRNVTWGNSSGTYDVTDTVTALKRVQAASAFFYTIPGPKMIWQFGELGYDVSIDEGGRTGEKPILWNYYDDPNRYELYQVTKELIALKTSYNIFQTNDVQFVNDNTLHKQLILKNSPYTESPVSADEMNMVMIGNFDVSSTSIDVAFPHTGTWYNHFERSKNATVSSTPFTIQLNPGEFRIFTDVELPEPNIDKITGLIENESYFAKYLYPNPTLGKVTLKVTDEKFYTIYVTDIMGKRQEGYAFEKSGKEGLIDIDLSGLVDGIYLIRVENDPYTTVTYKVVKQN